MYDNDIENEYVIDRPIIFMPKYLYVRIKMYLSLIL